MKSAVAALLITCVVPARSAESQSITAEAAITAGSSSEEHVSAAGAQVRVFGDISSSIRFFAEGAWGATTDEDTDAFGVAYPYRREFQVIEAYGESVRRPGQAIAGIKAGRYRTPFGISSGSDQGYTGFLRAPLIRYDGYFALSNGFLEHGVDLIVGVPRFTVETSLGVPADVGSAERRSGLDTVVRVQGYAGRLVAGVSYIHTLPYQNPRFAHGHAEFTGIDLRWMYSGIQLRGEWLTGRPFDGTTTTGWYADALVHRVGMGPVTVVARVESLSYETAPPFDLYGKRQTLGARIRLLQPLALQANVTHQTGGMAEYATTAVDVGLTYSLRLP